MPHGCTYLDRRVGVSAADREAARRSLARFQSPSDVLIQTKGNEYELVAAAFTVEILLEFAQPLPDRLRARLVPWFTELRRRREKILDDNRRTDRSGKGAGA